jgi:hypothetical protein
LPARLRRALFIIMYSCPSFAALVLFLFFSDHPFLLKQLVTKVPALLACSIASST